MKHLMKAFLLGFSLPQKTHYVWRLLILYFKDNEAGFQERWLSLEGISAQYLDWPKAQIVNISA